MTSRHLADECIAWRRATALVGAVVAPVAVAAKGRTADAPAEPAPAAFVDPDATSITVALDGMDVMFGNPPDPIFAMGDVFAAARARGA